MKCPKCKGELSIQASLEDQVPYYQCYFCRSCGALFEIIEITTIKDRGLERKFIRGLEIK